MYALEVFDADLKRLGLHEAVSATCFGINISVPTFYAILEMYCLALGTFFTPVGELGMMLHEMWEVSNLLISFKPYEKYFTCAEELAQLKKDEPAFYETYRKLMCHYYICLDLHPNHGYVIRLKSWVEYLFSVVDSPLGISRLRYQRERLSRQ